MNAKQWIVECRDVTLRKPHDPVQEHPWITLFSSGENLKPSYTFRPPYTGFEITVIAAGIIGVALIFFSSDRTNRSEE